MKGTVTSVGTVLYTPKHGEPYDLFAGVITGEDGRDYAFTASECFRNGTHSGSLTVGADAWFGSVEDGKACCVSYLPMSDEAVEGHEDRARRRPRS